MQFSSNAAPNLQRGPLARLIVPARPEAAANDNGEEPVSDAMLEASLRHFAAHGLGAARAARLQAEFAFFAGEDTRAFFHFAGCLFELTGLGSAADQKCGDQTG